MLALYLVGPQVTDGLQFERQSITGHQWWRFIGANLVHASGSHLAMNLVALVIITLVAGRTLGPLQTFLAWIISSLATTVGLWFLNPDIQWYLGASGALHGMLIATALPQALKRDFTAIAVVLFLVVKLAWEQWFGPLPGSESSVGVRVIVDAHLYGAIGGIISALVNRTLAQDSQVASSKN